MKTIEKVEILTKPIVDNFFGDKIQLVVNMQDIKGGLNPKEFYCPQSECRFPRCNCKK